MMRFIRPVDITDALFVSSSVAETDYAAWAIGTTYAIGDRVIKTATHRIYESAAGSNIGHDPATSPTWWVDIGPTNRWAMLDQTVGSSTQASSLIDLTLLPGYVDSLALLDVSAAQVQITAVDGVTTVYDRTIDMTDQAALIDWYMYFFEPLAPRTSVVIEDLPPYGSAEVRTRITGPGSVSCGTLAIGTKVELGQVRQGAKVGIIDYSKKTTDDYGVTSVVQRSYARRLDVDLVSDLAKLDYITDSLASIRAKPVVWIADERRKSLVIFGFSRDWAVVIAYATTLESSLTIEGLV